MADAYVSFDPEASINGETLRTLLASFQFPHLAGDLLTRYGLPFDPQPGHWYPLQAWLDVLSELELFYGDQTVYEAGLQVIANSVWPAHLTTLEQALEALDEACRLNVKGTTIGYYRIESRQTRAVLVQCLTPTPENYECGLLMGLARHFQPADAVEVQVHRQNVPLDASPHLKRFLVRW